MRGWILHKRSEAELTDVNYESYRFLESGRRLGMELRMFKPSQFDLIVSRDDRASVRLDGEITDLPDFLLPRTGAGTTYFGLAVIRHLERLGVSAINSSVGIENAKDKLYTQQLLASSDLPTPRTMLAKFPVDTDLVEEHLGYPLVIKPLSGSEGIGICLAESRAQFTDLLGLVQATNPNANLILQEFASTKYGEDLRVVTIGGRAVACMQRISPPGSFKSNFSTGGKVAPHALSREIEWLATEASKVCGLDIAGVDLLFDGDSFKICEVNSSPGFRGMESCLDVDIAGEILDYIRARLGFGVESDRPASAGSSGHLARST